VWDVCDGRGDLFGASLVRERLATTSWSIGKDLQAHLDIGLAAEAITRLPVVQTGTIDQATADKNQNEWSDTCALALG
jgi:hypothetical protein